MGQGPCTLPNGKLYPVCTVAANLNERRVLSLRENRWRASTCSTLTLMDDVTTMDYRGLKLAFQRRVANGIRLNGNWTWGRCMGGRDRPWRSGDGDPGGGGDYQNPADLDYDRGHCD
jgi:hypothetical protein